MILAWASPFNFLYKTNSEVQAWRGTSHILVFSVPIIWGNTTNLKLIKMTLNYCWMTLKKLLWQYIEITYAYKGEKWLKMVEITWIYQKWRL